LSRHYLDHASTTPVRPEALEAMLPWLSSSTGAADPGRVHTEGRMARVALEQAREQVAALVGARSREVVFTSGATESINAAAWMAGDRGSHVVCPVVEHSAVRDASSRAGGEGRGGVTWVGVDRLGRVDPDEVIAAVRPGDGGTAVVHLQWGNHEVATLQPVRDVVIRCREAGVLVHVDAAAAVGHVPVDFGALGADLLSVSGHKFGAPPGTGALLVRRGLRLRPFRVGGEQERARRAGVENVPALVGFGAAAAAVDVEAECHAQRRFTDRVLAFVSTLDGVRVLGDAVDRLPHLVCVSVDGVDAEPVLLGLDQAGIAAHSGSSCSSESLEPSPVLEAMGVEAERSLRISVGWPTTDADIDALCRALPGVLDRLRSLRSS
jgi:cysteine desulfurase